MWCIAMSALVIRLSSTALICHIVLVGKQVKVGIALGLNTITRDPATCPRRV